MALFDNLGKKLTEAGQTAVQKTKEMTDITRISGAISEEEKKIHNAYYQIGKLYTVLHSKDCEDDFAGMIQSVKDAETKIRDYRRQIQDIKGVVRCEKCGAEVSNSAAFCSACGNSMPKVEIVAETNLIKCDGCGALIEKNMRFCTSCGKPLKDVLQAEETLPRKCSNCGAEVSEDLAFCTECGTKLK